MLDALWTLPPAVAGAIAGALAGVVSGPLGVYLLNLYRTRPRLRAWQVREYFHHNPGYGGTPGVTFELENLGSETSLSPAVVLSGYTPHGERRRFTFDIDSGRRLPSHTPVCV